MKKVIALIILALMFTSIASAATPIDGTGLAIELSSGWEEAPLTSEDIEEGMIAYWYGSKLDLAIYVYEDDDTTVSEYLDYCKSDRNTISCGIANEKYAGLEFGYWEYKITDSGETYFVKEYFTSLNGSMIDFCFFYDTSLYSMQAASIMKTLSRAASVPTFTGTIAERTAIGTTGLYLSLPSGTSSEELTEEDIADDISAYYITDYNDIIVYVYESDFTSLNEIDEIYASDSDYIQHGITLVSTGIEFAYGVQQDTVDGEDFYFIEYITLSGKNTVQLVFIMFADEAAEASAEAASIIETISY